MDKANKLAIVFLLISNAANAVDIISNGGTGNYFQQVDKSVVCIESVTARGETNLGSGFFIAPNLVVTVAHQIGSVGNVIYREDGIRLEVQSIVTDKLNDLALIETKPSQLESQWYKTPLRLAKDEKLSIGTDVSTIGCPHGLDHTLSRGVVGHSLRKIEGKKLIQTDLAVAQGSSGGPLFDKSGQVVGIIHGMLKGAEQFSFAIPVQPLRLLLAEYFLREGKRTGFLTDLQQAYEYDPSNLEVKYWLSKSLYDNKQFLVARDLLLQVLAVNSDNADVLFDLGVVYLHGLNEHDSAKNSFLHFLKLSPNSERSDQVQQWVQDIEKMEQKKNG